MVDVGDELEADRHVSGQARTVDGNYEALMDPERAQERKRMADERLHGGFSAAQFAGVDFAAQRARLSRGREAHAPDPNSMKGDPAEKAGLKTKEEWAKEKTVIDARNQRALEAELGKDPAYRRQQALKREEEQAAKDKDAFRREAEERERRMAEKRQESRGVKAESTE
ncbi:unnamed protein product [Prorocentrum cordatum]|uniref:Uncharacterized protein n=1 Tax=Prorocentrum cordatum TaxID=2364126 RepID=A0ABN9WXX4_9DINO|nr:unnamed protein product [Polarella glacialis]